MSDWYQIENDSFIVQLTTMGAEMKRFFSKAWHRELLWVGDEKVWKRSAPVLFPIIGALKDGQYELAGKTYQLGQHGFARDMNFTCLQCKAAEIEFKLEANQETFKYLPFCFELRIHYKLELNKLITSYYVKNVDRQKIYFSIGAHPAFETHNPENYEIRFEKPEKEFFRLKNGLVDWQHPREVPGTLAVTPELFQEDALIFKKLKSAYVDLVDIKREQIIRMTSHTPFFGIWGKDSVPFVCLEPWHGVSDDEAHDGQLENKKGIIALNENEEFGFRHTIETLNLE
jgi:galactose mutarotase-like enzyme